MENEFMAWLTIRLKSIWMVGAVLCLLMILVPSSNASVMLRIEPESPEIRSCLAFGAGPGAGTEEFDDGAVGFEGTSPFMGFIYRNIPPFELSPGDLLSFDLGKENDFDVEIEIAMAATTMNGSLVEAEAFTTIVSNTQTPVNPRGDSVTGNYEMQFTVESPFSFSGGGLILRFWNGSDAYRADLTCDESQVGVVAKASDSSGYFVDAFWHDQDGIAPFAPLVDVPLRTDIIGGFQIIEPDKADGIMLTNDVVDNAGTQLSSVSPGEQIHYRATIKNPQENDASGIEITVTLAENVEFVSASTSPVGLPFTGPDADRKIIWTAGLLAVDEKARIDIVTQLPESNSDPYIENSARVSAIDTPFVGANEVTSITPYDSSITIESIAVNLAGTETTTVVAGRDFKYRVTVRNDEQVRATGMEVRINLPVEFEFLDETTTPVAAVVPGSNDPSLLTWTVGTLDSDSVAVLEVTMRVPVEMEAGTIIQSAAGVTAVDTPFFTTEILFLDVVTVGLAQDLLDSAGSSNCFIATAAYGSFLESEVIILRQFRDRYLLTNPLGRDFIDWYYQTSPPIADYIARHDMARQLVRWAISPFIFIIKFPVISFLLSVLTVLLIIVRCFGRVPTYV